MKDKKAIVLLSGGVDSCVTLFFALKKGYKVSCLVFDYGQKHRQEIEQALKIAQFAGCAYQVMKIELPWKGSSLVDGDIPIPTRQVTSEIPNTYVPGRNIIFLSFALSYAESIGAKAIFIGAHAQDYSGYPDCRPDFFKAFQAISKAGTKTGVENKPIRIFTPIIKMKKSQIIDLGRTLKAPLDLTWSCYEGRKFPCGTCDSCFYRAKGFEEAGLKDPALVR